MTALSKKSAKAILVYCQEPRTAKDIVTNLKVNHNLTPTLVKKGWLKRVGTRPMKFETTQIPEHLDWPSPLSPKNLHLLTALLSGSQTVKDLSYAHNRPDVAYDLFIERGFVEKTYDPIAFHLSPKGEALLASLGYKRTRVNSIFNFGAIVHEHRSLHQSL